MNISDLKRPFGDEYPAAVMIDGARLLLRRERLFWRSYKSDEHKMVSQVSRFVDGSASISVSELHQEWPGWTEDMRSDFCQSSGWLDEQSDFPEMLRFIMRHGAPEHWSAIALSVASRVPRNEAFDVLVGALGSTEIGLGSNIAQAIGHTRLPDAEAALRRHLAVLWSKPSLWEEDDFVNWVGFEVTTCIEQLIDVGASSSDFTDQVRRLSDHVCSGNRESCRNFLSKHYSWLN
jgi:hypothetical protein